MRIRIITTRYKKIMYAFDFETKEAKEDFFGYYEDIIEALQPKNEEWVEDFKKLVQTLQSRTDDKYSTEEYHYSGKLFPDEILNWICYKQKILEHYMELSNKLLDIIEMQEKTLHNREQYIKELQQTPGVENNEP